MVRPEATTCDPLPPFTILRSPLAILTEELQELPRSRPIVLPNVTCAYCGCALTEKSASKEHVIGRRFVPVGTLYQEWNLILRVCRPCNVKKSDLEDDISVITMHHDAFGNAPSTEAAAEVQRKKNKSQSRKTGKSVGDSIENVMMQASIGTAATMTFSFTGPPQIESQRAFELARLQMVGFFYFLTYSQDKKCGHFWQGGFFPIMEAVKADWGNNIHRSFMGTVLDWEPKLLFSTAKDHFSATIRKHPSFDLWSWAVEWNKSYRIVGFFGQEIPAKEALAALPSLEITSIAESETRWVRYRVDTPLKAEEDMLFF